MSWQSVTIGEHRLLLGKAEDVLPTLEDASVQLICVDPPFMNVKAEAWDRQWKTRDAYLSWLRGLAKEWQRVLAPSGSLYCFASPQMAAWVEVTLSEVFNIIQRVTWRKPPFSTKAEMFDKESCRMFFPASEAIIFAEQLRAESIALDASGYAAQCEALRGNVFEPLRAYLDDELRRSGWSIQAIRDALGFIGNMPFHWFARGLASGKKSGWQLPTQRHYERMQLLTGAFARPYRDLRREYQDLWQEYEERRREYEDFRQAYEDLRRPFAVSPKVPYTDVWDFATVSAGPGKHSAEKPLPLLRHIIEASSRPGDTVLDCCAGSFSTLEAAQQCGRKAIGIEQDAAWWRHGQSRLSQLDLFSAMRQAV